MECTRCEKEFESTHRLQVVCPACRPQHNAEGKHRRYLGYKEKGISNNPKKFYESAELPECTSYKPKPRPVLITNAAQREIDKKFEQAENIKFSKRVYTEGDAEWEALCRQVTPIHRVHEFSEAKTLIAAPMVYTSRSRYTGVTNELC